jgi:gliding motility-associated-like protein
MKEFIVISVLIYCLFPRTIVGQGLPGSGNAFRPNANAHIRVPNFPSTAYPLTITAWIRVPDTNASMTIISTDGTEFGYNGVWFQVDTDMQLSISAGNSGNTRCFTQHCRNTLLSFIPIEYANKWIHVAAVMTSGTTGQILVNGEPLPHATSGRGNGTITNQPQPNAIIGAFYGHAPGNNDIRNPFPGAIDEITVWSRALTTAEIRRWMCQYTPTQEPGLVAYFKFDEAHDSLPVADYTPQQLIGQTIGNLKVRKPSGAYIGDTATFIYGAAGLPGALPLHHTDLDGDSLSLIILNGSPTGVHLYTVYHKPLVQNGLDTSCLPKKYFGVYWADTWSAGDAFTATLQSKHPSSNLNHFYERPDNRSSQWLPGSLMGQDATFGWWFVNRSQEMIWSCDSYTPPPPPDPDPIDPIDVPSFELRIPNVFSPNGDGVNDFFAVELRGHGFYHIQIFNRWGQQVYESNDPEKPWDGRFNGTLLAEGVYMAIVNVAPLQGEKQSHRVVVHLLR